MMWFLLGYSFCSILYGALGSLASRTEDAQSAVGPLTMVLMVAYFVSFTTIDSPDGLVAVIGSFLPPTAPLMMPIRTALTDVPLWQPIAAVAVELAAIVGRTRPVTRRSPAALGHSTLVGGEASADGEGTSELPCPTCCHHRSEEPSWSHRHSCRPVARHPT